MVHNHPAKSGGWRLLFQPIPSWIAQLNRADRPGKWAWGAINWGQAPALALHLSYNRSDVTKEDYTNRWVRKQILTIKNRKPLEITKIHYNSLRINVYT